MSDEEQYAAQGRVYAELKLANGKVATLRESLRKSAKDLENLAIELQRYLVAPTDPAAGFVLQENLRMVSTELIAKRVAELEMERDKAAALQQRVDRF